MRFQSTADNERLHYVKPHWPNGCNVLVQHRATLLHGTCCMPLATMLHICVAFVWPNLLNMLQHDPTMLHATCCVRLAWALLLESPGQMVLPTQAKLQNQNLHRRMAKRYRQVEPACKKTIQLSDHDRAVT